MLCPCCSGLDYSACCQPYLIGEKEAPTALSLMRSRYSAYAKGLVEYIVRTTHPKNPQYQIHTKKWVEEIRRFIQETQFVKLEIEGFGDDWVAFIAFMVQNGRSVLLKEKSQFAKLDGKWLYLSGVFTKAV